MPDKFTGNVGPYAKPLAGAAPGDMRSRFNELVPMEVQNAYQQKAEIDVLEADRLENQKLLQEQRNVKLNSLKSLYRQAMPNPQFADRAASSVFDRIENAGSKQELNDIYSEIEGIREKAQDSLFLFDGMETFSGIAQSLASTAEGFFFGKETEVNKKKKLLKQANPDLNDVAGSVLPRDLFSEGVNAIKEAEFKSYGQQILTQYESPLALNQALDKARHGSSGAYKNFDAFVAPRLDDAFATKGHYLYREGEEAAQFQKDARKAFADPTYNRITANFKHDLEKESLSSLKGAVMQKLQGELLKPRDAVDYNPDNIKNYRNSLNIIDQRLNSLSGVYKVDKYSPDYNVLGGSSSTIRSTIKAFSDTLPGQLLADITGQSDFDKAVGSEAFYKPEVITYDAENRPVMSNQFMYTKADGSKGFNYGAIPEAGGAMVAQMLPIIATGGLVGGAVRGLAGAELGWASSAAAGVARGYDAINKVSAFGKELQLADRAATFASVAANTIPHFVEQEKRWGGNYFKRGFAGGIVEASAEAIGFPDVGALKMRPMTTTLASSAMRSAGLELNFGQRLGAYLNNSYEFAKMATKQNAVEALEEELSLIGNSIVQNTLMPEEYALRDREEVTAKTLTDTLVESFAAGLIYSFGTTGTGAYSFTRPENLKNMANWEAANNADLFVAKLSDLKDKGKITDQDFIQGMAKVRNLQGTLKSMVGFDNIRDLKTLNVDKDEQYNLFTNLLRKNDLLTIDYDSLSEDEKNTLAKYKIANKLSQKEASKIEEIKKQLAEISTKENPTPAEIEKSVELTLLYQRIKRANIQAVKKGEISEEDKKFFYERGLLQDTDLQFTREDIDKEIASIDKSILKTQKRIDRYANLTDSEKRDVIRQVYDEKIDAVMNIDGTAELVSSMSALKKDLEYLKLKGEEEVPGQIEHKERLLDAYGKQMYDLTNERDEFGQNKIEQKVSTFDAVALEQEGDFYSMLEAQEYLSANKDHVNQELYDTVQENLNDSFERAQAALAEATPEVRSKILTDFLDKVTLKNTKYAYNVNLVNSLFPSAEYTQEELDNSREELIQRRAQRRSAQVLGTETLSEDEEEQKDQKEFNEVAARAAQTPEVVDESGKSNRDDIYLEGYNKMLEKAKNSPTGFAKAFESTVKSRLTKVFSSGTKDYNTLINAFDNLLDKKITPEEFRNIFLSVWRDNKADEKKANAVIFLKFIADRYFANDMPADRVASTTPAAKTTPVTPATTTPPKTVAKNAPTPKQGGKVDRLNEVVTQEVKARMTQLEYLASPLRSIAFEYNRQNEKNQDPAVLRNVAIIEKLPSIEGSTIRVMNRKLFLLYHIGQRSRDVNPREEFEKIVTHISENQMSVDNWNSLSEEEKESLVSPIDAIIGKNFYDESMLRFFFTSTKVDPLKPNELYPVGSGLFTNPEAIITAIDEEKNLITIDGLPMELNMPTVSKGEYPISDRIIEEYSKLGGSEQELRNKNVDTFERLKALKKAISEADSLSDTLPFLDFDFNVSSGVMLRTPINTFEKGNTTEVESVKKARISDFKIIEDPRESVFGKSFAFEKGRVYFNNNGNPTLLTNNKIDSAEADALAEVYFSEENPYFASPKEAEAYLFNLINQVDKKTRLHFFVNEEYPGPGQFPVIIVKSEETGKGFTNTVLTKEEFASTLKNHYYKASLALMKSGEPILRFKPEGAVTQNYAEYLKDTHNFPIKDGEVARPVNKVVYLSTESLAKQFPEITGIVPEVETPKQVPTTPAQPAQATQATDTVADKIISNGDRIINVQTKPITDEITDTDGELFLTSDKDPGGRVYINMDPLKNVLVVPNNTLTVIDKNTGKEVVSKELNPEGAVIFEAMQGRLFVVANINGQLVPFYKSSAGTSGKTQGDWYPFFGYTGAWLVKGGIDKGTGKMSYSPEIDKVTKLLNENLVFPDKYIDRATNTIKGTDGEVLIDMNVAFKINRLEQKEFGSQTGKGTNYQIKGLKENTRSGSGVVALITGLNTTSLDSSKTPKELSEWFSLISKNAEPAAKPSEPSALQTLSILVFPTALKAISKSAVPDAPQLSAVKTVGEEFYQMAINTVLADPGKLSTVYYPKLIKNGEGKGASVYFELTPYDPTDPGALGSPFYIARVQIAEREKPVTLVLVKPKSPFGGTFGTPRFLAEIDLANPSEGKMSSTVPSAPVAPIAPVAPVEPPVTKKARPVLTANTFEEPQAEVTSESPFLDSLQDEEELRAAAKEVKDACKGDLDDIA